MKKYLLLLVFTIVFNILIANPLDSLQKLLQSPLSYAEKIDVYKKLLNVWMSKNPVKSVIIGRQALNFAEKNNDVENQIYFCKLLGKAYYFLGKKDSSIYFFNKTIKLSTETKNLRELANAYNNVGIIFKANSQNDTAIKLFHKAINTARQANAPDLIAAALANLGNIYRNIGNLNAALDVNLKALQILDSLGSEDKKLILLKAKILTNTAVIFSSQRNFEQSKKYYLKALKTYKTINYTEGIASTYLNLGTIFSEQNNLDSAAVYFKKAYKLFRSPYNKAMAIYNLGDTYNALNQPDSAYPFLTEALDLYRKLNDKSGIARVYSSLGQNFYLKKQYDKAISYLKKSYDLAVETKDLTIRKNAADWLSRAYKAVGKYKEALEMHIIFKELNDSLFNAENERKMTQLSLQYEFDKKQREQELIYKSKIQKQKIISRFIAAVSLLMLILLFTIYRSLRLKKKANEMLKLKNAEILQQKEEIEAQRDEIEAQKEKIELQAVELQKQRDIAVKQRKNIEDSIHYALRIQEAVMPDFSFLKSYLTDYFLFFKPRDIVSGDFYWAAQKNNYIVITIADCTGHGVPGAFMSLLGITFLNEILATENSIESNIILDKLRQKVISSLKQTDDLMKTRDGMDMALVVIDTKTNIMQYSGAYNPLYVVLNKESHLEYTAANEVKTIENEQNILYEFKADKFPIGLSYGEIESFSRAEIKLQKGIKFYMFSDGFPSLFNFDKNQKFTTKRFRELILEISGLSFDKQKEILEKTFNDWLAGHKQIDDVLVGGFLF